MGKWVRMMIHMYNRGMPIFISGDIIMVMYPLKWKAGWGVGEVGI